MASAETDSSDGNRITECKGTMAAWRRPVLGVELELRLDLEVDQTKKVACLAGVGLNCKTRE